MPEGGKFDWKDYLAFVIALLTTNLLPLIIIGIIMVILSYFIVQMLS